MKKNKNRKRKCVASPEQYKNSFFKETAILARNGKTVYICKEHHERITKILHVIAKNEASLFSYIYNVLEHHFNTYRDDITQLYDNNIEKVF